MRTTLELPDPTFRQLKSLAAQRGTSLKHLLRTAVERELALASGRRSGRRLKFPILDSREPRSLHLANAEIEDLLT